MMISIFLLSKLDPKTTLFALFAPLTNAYSNIDYERNVILSAFVSYFSDLLPTLGGLYAATNIHKALLRTILHVPLSFLDRNPTGRILSRFSVDVEILDNDLPDDLLASFECLCEVKINILDDSVGIAFIHTWQN